MRIIKSHLNFTGIKIIYIILFCVSCNHDDPFPPVVNTNSNNSNIQEVIMQNTAFNPSEISITKGTTIRWINKDAIPHTATSDQVLFDSGNMNSNSTYEFLFESTGTFNYHCNYHFPHMTGKIIVNP